jgi:hypothetical protein
MKPILDGGVRGLVEEPDPVLAEQAVASHTVLVEGVARSYPEDRELLLMASMARSTYAFAFLQDDLEAARLGAPDDEATEDALLARILEHFAIARGFAARALGQSGGWTEALGGQTLEEAEPEAVEAALAALDPADAEALFWLAFAWGGALQADLDPAAATALPKVEAMAARVLELDDEVFYGLGPHMMTGVIHGFRAPAIGGDPEKAAHHFAEAKRLSGGVLLPDVLLAQYVYAQTGQVDAFRATLEAVIAAEPRRDRALLEVLAKRKACRLLANLDAFFLEDAAPPPAACARIPRKYPLRSEPLDLTGGGVRPPARGEALARAAPAGPRPAAAEGPR